MLTDPEIILTKNRIMEEMKAMMARLAECFRSLTWGADLEPFLAAGPKISRGENYEGLPWIVLDYPRFAAGDALIFIRSMFWWGQHFSSTLQLHGPLADRVSLKHLKETYIGINTDRWQHHFRADNYRLLGEDEPNSRTSFLKLARRLPVAQWAQAEAQLEANWKDWMGLIAQAVK